MGPLEVCDKERGVARLIYVDEAEHSREAGACRLRSGACFRLQIGDEVYERGIPKTREAHR
jgi:hypothetical protein